MGRAAIAQHVVERRTGQTEISGMALARQGDTRNIGIEPTVLVAQVEAGIGEAARDGLISNPELIECAQEVGLNDDANVIDFATRADFDNIDIVSGLAQANRRAQSANAAADYEHLAHVGSPLECIIVSRRGCSAGRGR